MNKATDITDGVEESVECPSSDLAQMRLELGKPHLDAAHARRCCTRQQDGADDLGNVDQQGGLSAASYGIGMKRCQIHLR